MCSKRIIMLKLSSILIAIILFFSACVKTYSCKCTTTLSLTGYYPKETVTVEKIKKNSTKKKATQICNNTAEQIQESTKKLYTPNSGVEVKSKCELKDY